MVKIYLKNKIFIKLSQLEKHQRDFIISKYRFKYEEYSAFTKKYEYKSLNLFELVTWKNNEKWVALSPNIEYFQNIMKELEIEVNVIDLRVAPQIKFPNIKISPRDKQSTWIEKLEKFDFNALLTLPTGSGKTLISIYIAGLLKTPTIFIASKTSYLESFKKEVHSFVENAEDNIQVLDTKWFENDTPQVKAYNICSIQTLSRNLKHLEKLQNSFGLVIADEIHSSLFSGEYRKALYSLNTRHKIFLSATPKIKSMEIVNCMVSSNLVSDDTDIDFDIIYQPITLDLNNEVTREVLQIENHNSKKSVIFSLDRLQHSVADLTEFAVGSNRGVIVFSTNKVFQESISTLLNEKNISNVIFNSDTKKELYDKYLKEFDENKIQVIIGGTALIEALSLYRLSIIIDTDLSLSDNSIIQLIGRLKRLNPEICSKQKVYMKLIYKNISEKKFRNSILPVLRTMDYVKVQPTKFTDTYDLVGLFKHKL
jgi:superfamily II DNA or RNA helicase